MKKGRIGIKTIIVLIVIILAIVLFYFNFSSNKKETPIKTSSINKLTIIDWLGGINRDSVKALEAGFMKKYPNVKVVEIPVTWSGDARGGIRTVLMGGEKIDLVVSAWPSFVKELASAGYTRSLDKSWTKYHWDKLLSKSWRSLGSVKGVSYSIPFVYGDRSGLWYLKKTFKNAGIKPPKTWDEMLGGFKTLRANGIVPMGIPAKTWAQGETFETLYIRINGVKMASKLVAHKIPWTDESVKATFRKWRELLQAGCCAKPNTMFATEWQDSADNVLKKGKTGYFLMGMWVNARAISDYKLKPDVDYGFFQFPALGLGHDNTSIIDDKEFVALKSGKNPKAADEFLGYMLSKEGTKILAKFGFASPSNKIDATLFDPITKKSINIMKGLKVHFVLGDMLPSDLSDEYRMELQKFLQNPSDANIDAVTADIEAKAKSLYK